MDLWEGKAIYQLSKNHLERYKTLFKTRFGKELDDKTAHDQLLRLLVLVSETYKPMTKKEYEEVLKEKESIKNRRKNVVK